MESGYYVLLGTLVGALSSVLITWINSYYGERKHHREVIIKTGLENWKQACDFSMSGKLKGKIQPLDYYLLHMNKLANLVVDKKINVSNIENTMQELKDFSEKLKQVSERFDQVKYE